MNINDFLEKISGFVWGNGLIFLLLSTGLIYTLKLGFIQFRFIPCLIRSVRNSRKNSKGSGISQLKTVCLALGTAMGTGNITGVASALAIGGPGAIFWMWVSAFFGMALVYSENYLAVTYRKPGECTGPMAYLRYGLGSRVLPIVFAILCLAAALGMGGMVQVSSFTDNLYQCCDVKPVIAAVIIFAAIFLVTKGGIGRIGSAAQALLPAVTIAYAAVSVLVIFRFRENIIPSFREIFTDAFSFTSAAGGVSGFAVSKAVSAGIRRGIFSNEAGLGSSPILHCASDDGSPSLQGMWSIFEVFFDTIICCTLTALVLLTSGGNENYSVAAAFGSILGDKTDLFLTAAMAVFAFCTIIGWYYCGESAFTYLFGTSKKKTFCLMFALFSALGAVLTLETVFALSDIFNGLMAIPNLLGLLLLFRKVQKE
ncbi:MAG: sodium:alanine symporter family protein [Ruminococcus sp.]|nr:sodium:alanine symporter family protein [Ruminococcus sp.]